MAGPPAAVYNAVPNTLPPNVVSLGYEATSTSELGDYVHLGGANRLLRTVTVTMSDWALASDYPTLPPAGWTHPITVNIYSSHLGPNGAPDKLLATTTQTIAIPWRPPASPTARARPGRPTTATVTRPRVQRRVRLLGPERDAAERRDRRRGVRHGRLRGGADSPAGPLQLAERRHPDRPDASVGSDDNADDVFWNTSFAGFYTDGGAGGVGIFRQDTNWTPNGTVALQITAAPADLTLDKQDIGDKGCKPAGSHAEQIVDVHGKLINDYDSGFAGNAWANDSIDRHLRIWQLDNGTYCSQVEDNGKFVTFAGTSPSGLSTVTAGVKGNIDGGYVTTFFTGNFDPQLPTHGDVGTFDLQCTDADNCPGASLNHRRYFSSTAGDDLAQWGWIYKADAEHGTCLDQDDVPAASSGDITG